jgi:lipopolysaccharide transport system ATP-binding protein
LELGAGFNPEFTGRENVMLSGALLGISAQEMQERLPAILEFSELGDFIDRPVKTYSSGMYVRLAFSAAIHVEPDVLLVDEALSVGDAAFQYKCMERIKHLRSRGMSILFVTHDTGAVRKICDRAFWLDSGNLVSVGEATAVADDYDSFMRAKSLSSTESHEESWGVRKEDAEVVTNSAQPSMQSHGSIRSVELKDQSDRPIEVVCIGGEVRIVVTYEVAQRTSELVVGVAIFRNDQLYVSGLNTGLDNFRVPSELGVHSVILSIPSVTLVAGVYFCKVGLFDATGMVKWDFWDCCGKFKVFGPYLAEGIVIPKHSWQVSNPRS